MKETSLRTLLIAVASAFILTSCSMTKEGHTMSLNSEKLEPKLELQAHKSEQTEPCVLSTPQEVLACENWIPSKNRNVPLEIFPTKHMRKNPAMAHLTASSDNCDELVLYGGDRIKAKVLEINDNEIKYKKCDNIDGPTYTMSKSNIREIHYANGTDEMVSETGTTESKTIAPSMKVSYLGLSILMFLGALLSYIIATTIETTAAAATGTVAISGIFTASILASVHFYPTIIYNINERLINKSESRINIITNSVLLK